MSEVEAGGAVIEPEGPGWGADDGFAMRCWCHDEMGWARWVMRC